MQRNTRTPTRIRLFTALFALVIVSSSSAQNFGNESMHKVFAFTASGTFSSAPPPFTGPAENVAFSGVGLFRFDGNGQVRGDYTFVVQGTTLGRATPFTAAGTYSVDPDGRMIIRTEDFVGGVRANEIAYECVIVQRNRLAQCAFIEVVSFQQGPDPVVLPVTGLVKLER